MFQNQFVEGLRTKAIMSLFRMAGFNSCWPIWAGAINSSTNSLTSAEAIYRLGEQLSGVFRLTAGEERSQSALSGGGASWEGLVCWYLNLVLTGTRAVVIKQSKILVPSAISEAITVNYNNHQTNTESDLLGIVFPEDRAILDQPYDRATSELYVGENIEKMEVHNIQCKTNWNDNAQIPMLWDMIYRAKGFKDSGVSVGRNGRSIGDLAKFTYSFVTIPSQRSAFKTDQMAVKRVSGLSGGNFWGQPTQSGVAWSINEMFKHVFGDQVIGDVRRHIGELIQNGSIRHHLGD